MSVLQHLAKMTLREKCGQLIFPAFRFESPDYEAADELVRKQGVGGMVLYGGSVFDVPSFVNWGQKVARIPLLVAADYECGAGFHVAGATLFPTAMAVGAAGSEELALSRGRQTALEARALGVRWILAPVVDLNTNPRNPVINVRAFGEDPAAAVRLARATLQGFRTAKVMGCLKHFPGHGDVAVDSHLALPGMEKTDEAALRPYRELSGEVESIMAAHLVAKDLDEESPVSLSRAAILGFLRGELRFDGVVATDALDMGGITKTCTTSEALERAANAGADALLCPPDALHAAEALEAAVKAGRVAEATIDRAAARVLRAKERLGLFSDRGTDVASVETVTGSAAHRATAQKIADQAATLVRGSGRLPARVAIRASAAPAFEKELRLRLEAADDAAGCVVATAFRPKAFAGVTEMDEAALAPIREAVARYKEVMVVSFGSPYVIRQLPEGVGFACLYGDDESSQRAAAKALTGEIEWKGKMPVRVT